jgi:acyl-CoA synthetase (AMP-forming)/AMP-acid ligase II
MTVTSPRAQLAADPDLGAGNVLTTLVARGIGLDEPSLTFDTDVGPHPAWQPLTIRELDRQVRARAARLQALGVRRRDPVAVSATAAADIVLTFLALTRLGAIPALLNAKVPPELAAIYLRRLRAVGLLADAERLDGLAGQDFGTPVLEEIGKLGAGDPDGAPPAYRHAPGDPVAVTHSSGTTGVPKAVVHSHATLFAALRHRLTLPRARGTERILSAFPVPHAAGLIVLNQALSGQGQLLMLSRQTGPTVLDAIERWRPAAVFGFATTWADLAHHDLAARDLDSITLWSNTGDCAHEAHIRRLIAHGHRMVPSTQGPVRKPGSSFIDALGSSEMGHSHFFITHTPETNRYGRCIGRPHAWADVVVLDPDDNVLPDGEIGEIATKAPTLSLGYWNDSVTTYRTRVRGYFLTGDLGYRDADGYFYQVDRLVDAVDLGGGKRLFTALSEERILLACPDVVDCTVVAVRDGDAVVTDVLLELEDGADPAADRDGAIREALGPDVAATLRRSVVVGEDDIPLGPTGKVRKFALRERYLATQGAL